MTTYSVTIKVDPTYPGNIGHAFMTFSASGQPDISVGLYPASGLAIDQAVVRNDSVSFLNPRTNTIKVKGTGVDFFLTN